MIKVEGLVKRFGEMTAVNNLNLEIPPGELFVFLGPNGAGKTTTIKLIVGLLRPSAGRVFLCGYDVQKQYIEARALLSYVPDQPFLYDKLTGREFLQFVGAMYGMDRRGTDERIAYLTDLFELSGFLDDLGQTYSHGMKQRVVISAALLHNPRVLVIDEPMVGLDPKGANTFKAVLRELARQQVTIFVSTHTLDIAEEAADRVGIIRDGSLIALGTLDQIYSAARTDRRLEQAFLRLTEEA